MVFRKLLLAASLCLACAHAFSGKAEAQPVPVMQPPAASGIFDRPAGTRPGLPEYEPEETGSDLSLPPLRLAPGKEKDLARMGHVFVRSFVFSGNTVIPDGDLAAVAAPYTGREITAEELQQLRRELTLLYIRRGYLNSGVVIPDQQVAGQVIVFSIIEGRLTSVEVSGTSRLREAYIACRLLLEPEEVLKIENLQDRIRLLDQNPRVKRVRAKIVPGRRPGEATLKAEVQEERPCQLGLQFANDRSPSIGGERLLAHATHRNLTGWGDTLALQWGTTEGLDDYWASYEIPLTRRDTSVRIHYARTDSTVVEEPFDGIDITSDFRSGGVTVSRPFLKTPSSLLTLSLGLESRKSTSTLLGEPYSFSEGVQAGESTITVARFSQDWLHRAPRRAWAARSVLSFGLDALGATINPTGPDGQFFTWLGQGQVAQRLTVPPGSQVLFRTDAQWASDPLLPLEKFAIGGAATVRGYRENLLVRDSGLVASLELRVPLFRLPLPRLSQTVADGMVQLAPFFDFGTASNKERPTPQPRSIAGVGAGLRWDPSANLHAELYLAKDLRDVDTPANGLQDRGIHFLLSWVCF